MDEIVRALENYIPVNEQEEKDKIVMLEFIKKFDDVLTRNNKFGHFSASAFVVNEDFTKTLLVHHNILGGYIYPGGHADGETNLLGVALREVEEETGLNVVPYTEDIFAIQANPTQGHVKRGEYITAHTHYDILYLLIAKNVDMDKIRVLESENSSVIWTDLDASYNGNDIIDWVRPINEKIVTKVRRLERK